MIPLRAPAWGLRDVFFTPGLHLIGDKLAFIKQMPMFETHTIGKKFIVSRIEMCVYSFKIGLYIYIDY